jgi:hypothetical protein
MAKVSFLELDEDGFFPEERPRSSHRNPKRNMPCCYCGKPNSLTDLEHHAGIACKECEKEE